MRVSTRANVDDYLANILSVARGIETLLDATVPSSSSSPSPSRREPEATVPPTIHATRDMTLALPPPPPLTHLLVSLGLKYPIAKSLSLSYLRAVNRLKVKVQVHFQRVLQPCIDASLRNGCAIPESQYRIHTIYEAHFVDTVTDWANRGMSITRDRLMAVTLKAAPHLPLKKEAPSPSPLSQQASDSRGFLAWSTFPLYTFKTAFTAINPEGEPRLTNYFKPFMSVSSPGVSSSPSPSPSAPTPLTPRHKSRKLAPQSRRFPSTLSIIGDPFKTRQPSYAFPTPYITKEAESRRHTIISQRRDWAVPVLSRGLRKVSTSCSPADMDGLVENVGQMLIQDDNAHKQEPVSIKSEVKDEDLLPPIGFPLGLFPVTTSEIPSLPKELQFTSHVPPAPNSNVASSMSSSSTTFLPSSPSSSPAAHSGVSSSSIGIAFASTPPAQTSQAQRRKIAPMPKRLPRESSRAATSMTDAHGTTSKAAVSLNTVHPIIRPTTTPTHLPPTTASSEVAEPSRAPSRTRKFAPLPKRRSAAKVPPSPNVPLSSDSKAPIELKPSMPAASPPVPVPSTPVSRTSSLTCSEFSNDSPSSSSSRSTSIFSSSSSSSKFSTPPSSPPKPVFSSLHPHESNFMYASSRAPIIHPSIFEAPPTPDRFNGVRHLDGIRALNFVPESVGELFHPHDAAEDKWKGKAVHTKLEPADDYG